MNSGCDFEYTDPITTKVYLIEKGQEIFTLTKDFEIEDLNKLQQEKLVILAVLENSGLSSGTEVEFYITREGPKTINEKGEYEATSVDVRVGEDTLKGIVDDKGNAIAEWIVEPEDFGDYDGRATFILKAKINGTEIHNIDRPGILSHESSGYALRTKEGDCEGNIVCINMNKEICDYYEGCDWNYETSSCEGEGKLSCDIIDEKDVCEYFEDCKWKPSGFWKRLTSWLGKLFG
jgi:hypothetical protein